MKINKIGVVVFTDGDIKIEGWQAEREDSDPADATNEQLLLAYAIHWANEKFRQAGQGATLELMRRLMLRKKVNVISTH